jgi:hypothetical protein
VVEQEMARKLHSDRTVIVSVLKSVARRRQVKTENPSACATVDWKMYRITTGL